ncbi:MAG: peptidyl-prolyl cis-trans isomerase B (cyclophilin B) [Planctomycetota bacterium]|jgi:peptidyl-prolyl cis-trans isomerase B (cyclophilin B)
MTNTNDGVTATLLTDAGELTLEFFNDKAPGHVKNFIELAEKGDYDGTKFHRVIPGFMIQGGDPNTRGDNRSSWGTGGPGYQIDAEFSDVHHERGILSMARSQDPNSAGSQFFICHGEAGFLDQQYTAFGRLTDGFDALDSIANGKCKAGGEASSPIEPISVQSVRINRAKAE